MVRPHGADVGDARVVPADVDFALEGAAEEVVDVRAFGNLPGVHCCDDFGDPEDGAAAGGTDACGDVFDIEFGDGLALLGCWYGGEGY